MATPLEIDLEKLLAVWRATLAPEVADMIDRVSAVVVASEPPIVAVGGTSAKKAWHDAIATRRTAILPRLLETTADGIDRFVRVRAFLELPPDPRIGTQIRAWLTTPAVLGQNRAGFYFSVLDVVEHVKDVRLVRVLAELAANRTTAIRRCGISNYRKLVAVAERMATVKPAGLDPPTRALLRRVGESLAKPSKLEIDPAELFARVYADPADDTARAVLADVLSERGDPRGEFINLQLARFATGKRPTSQERRLEQTWGRTWLGALEPAILKGGVDFERGFVSRVRYIGGKPGAATIGAPEWSTVTAIDASEASKYGSGSGALLASPVMKSLRAVTGIAEHDLASICADLKRVPWPTLGFRVFYWNRLSVVVDANGARNAFADVRSLRIANAGSGLWQIDAPLVADLLTTFPALEDVELELQTDFDALVAHPSLGRLRRITLFRRANKVTYDRATGSFIQ